MTERALNYVGGRWIWPEGSGILESHDPADWREIVATAPDSSAIAVDQAVAAARGALPGWKRMPPPRRGDLIRRAAEILARDKEQLGRLVSLEMGKPLVEGRGDVQEAIDMAYLAAGEGRRLYGETVPCELPNKLAFTFREPVGVCALITPWNFPTAIPAWKGFHALICGNTFVLKPAEDVPLCASAFVKCLEEAGFPPGVVNLVHGRGEVAGAALVDHPDVNLVSFTGSSEVGAQVGARCALRHANVSLEMGGKNAQIVLADADLDLALEGALWGAFGTAGQRCTATSRLLVDHAIHDAFLKRLCDRVARLRLGAGTDPATEVCPLVNEQQFNRVMSYIGIGRDEGARLVVGGRDARRDGREHGWFVEPTVFAEVTPAMRIFQEEIFGPVLSVVSVPSLDEGVRLLNDSIYGLSSSIYTRDVNAAMRAMRDIEAGIVYVNGPTIGAEVQLPFGGVKVTGNGHREAGRTGLDVFTEWKSVFVDYSGHLQKAQIDTPSS
jgi:acyl-CoA reductase-like NAD-dependent aldehyde dehydrogenase